MAWTDIGGNTVYRVFASDAMGIADSCVAYIPAVGEVWGARGNDFVRVNADDGTVIGVLTTQCRNVFQLPGIVLCSPRDSINQGTRFITTPGLTVVNDAVSTSCAAGVVPLGSEYLYVTQGGGNRNAARVNAARTAQLGLYSVASGAAAGGTTSCTGPGLYGGQVWDVNAGNIRVLGPAGVVSTGAITGGGTGAALGYRANVAIPQGVLIQNHSFIRCVRLDGSDVWAQANLGTADVMVLAYDPTQDIVAAMRATAALIQVHLIRGATGELLHYSQSAIVSPGFAFFSSMGNLGRRGEYFYATNGGVNMVRLIDPSQFDLHGPWIPGRGFLDPRLTPINQ